MITLLFEKRRRLGDDLSDEELRTFWREIQLGPEAVRDAPPPMAEASSGEADIAGGAGDDVQKHVSASTQRDLEAMEGRLEAIAGLRSGAGLLVRDLQRLLLSAENTAFDPYARSQECDMSLPLSRYWINSSHKCNRSDSNPRPVRTCSPTERVPTAVVAART